VGGLDVAMDGENRTKRGRLRLLLASSSVAALLIGSGASAALATTCSINDVGVSVGSVSNSSAINCINIQTSTVTNNVTNAATGTITAGAPRSPPISTGITINNSSIGGTIFNAGKIIAPTAGNGIFVTNNATVSGGIVNSGTISAGAGIFVGANAPSRSSVTLSAFSGGITNSGKISGTGNGIFVGANADIFSSAALSTFSGGIVNSGTISGGGISVGAGAFEASSTMLATFFGGITNTGKISGGGISVGVGAGFYSFAAMLSTFAGGISNSGKISGGGISVSVGADHGSVATLSAFSGGISNSGKISGGGISVLVGANTDGNTVALSTFSGGIVNSGKISGGGISVDVNAGLGSRPTIGTFSGGITNSGKISTTGNGIFVGGHAGVAGGLATVSAFSGGIVNSGKISAGENGIFVGGGASIASFALSTFSGGIRNSGTISAVGRGIVVAGSSTRSNVRGSISTFSGNISNRGTMTGNTGIVIGPDVTFAAASAVVNSGIITGGGGTAIDAGGATSRVIIDQNAGVINGAVKLSANADVLNISGGAINGNIVGQGASDTINFALGSGTFNYAAAYGFSGINQVNINSGAVVLNGANSAANINVNGGTLAGAGTLDPLTVTIHSGATFAPGAPGAPGTTMTITGNLAFQSGALYVAQLNSLATTSAKVSGTAMLNGVVVNAQFASGSYLSKQYTILTAAGGFGGTTFAGVTNTNLPAGASDSLSYDAGHVYLNLNASFTGLTVNQQNVANALSNYFNTTGGIPAQFLGLSPNGLTQMDGEVAVDGEFAAFQIMGQFLNLVLDPFVDGRLGSGVGGVSGRVMGFAPDEETGLPPAIALAYAGVLKAPPMIFDQRWTAWGASYGGGNWTSGNTTTGSSNLTAQTYGFVGGMDYHYSPDTIFGLALGGGGTAWGLAGGLGTGRSDVFQTGIYGITRSGPAYISAALAFANHWMTTSRSAMGDGLTANFDAQSYGARIEGGYRYAVLPALGVTPYAAIQAQDFHTPSYSETDVTGGGFGLSYAAMNATDVRTEFGARFDNPEVVAGMPLLLRARIAWAHDFVSDPSLSAAFESLPGTNFVVNGAPMPQNSALTSAGAELYITPRLTLLAKFDGEFAPGSQTYAGSGTLRYTW